MTHVLLVGCGRMGSALLGGWLAAGAVSSVDVVEPGPASVPSDPRVRRHRSPETVEGAPDVVVIAIKPQMMADGIPPYRRFAAPGTVFLSIAAGKTLAWFADRLGDAPLVRAMPNTPAAIGKGISVMVASPGVSPVQRALCQTLLAAGGDTAWVEDEALIDVVTAVSGSGPAYVFHMIEALEAAGRAQGLPDELATRLARRTIIGAGALAEASAETAAQLRIAVTSPKGTTQAALDVLMAPGGLVDLMGAAVDSATRRSRELAG
jgi:pyrroline-5-carboxylate reductase